MSTTFPTEEDIRSRLIIPYLTALGISPNDIELEKSFKLRLGRSAYEVNSEVNPPVMRGRLDILVRNPNGDNLFLVEVKSDAVELTLADRDQAISYARLLDQIAPFAIVTNGRRTVIYDTITKHELTPEGFAKESHFFSAGGLLTAETDLQIRYEALLDFIGYSHENVAAFSSAQLQERMEGLRGSRNDRSKKYLPDVYQRRHSIDQSIDRFLAGQGAVLAIVGASGVGKTNELCALAERCSKNYLTFFFAAKELHKTLEESISDDFNWQFTEQIRTPEIIRRLERLARRTKRSVLLLIDGIEDAVVPNFKESIGEFALRLKQYSGAVKLIMSAKAENWQDFTRTGGSPSALFRSLDSSWQSEREDRQAQAPVLELGPFTGAEFDLVARRYVKFFNLSGSLRGRLREDCRSPFLLRVAAEVYENGAQDLPEDLSPTQLLRSWLDRKFDNMRQPDRARTELEAVAKGIYLHSQAQRQQPRTLGDLERVPLRVVRELLKVSAIEPILSELISHDVLVPHAGDEEPTVSFYYSTIRDYIIATRALALPDLPTEEFRAILPLLLSNHVLQGALAWDIENGPAAHTSALRSVVAGRAAAFVSAYQQILDYVLPGAKPQMDPRTPGRVGIAFEVDGYGLRSFGVVPISAESPARVVELHPVYDGTSNPFAVELWRRGGKVARGGGKNFSNQDPTLAASQFAFDRLIEVIKEGRLDETRCKPIVAESIMAIATHHAKKLNLPPPATIQELFVQSRSIDPRDLSSRLHAHFGEQYYRQQWMDQQKTLGSKWVTRHNASSYSVRMDPEAAEAHRVAAKREAAVGKRFPARHVIGEEDLIVLAELLDFTIENELDIESSLVQPDILPPYPDYRLHWAYSSAALATLLEQLFTLGLNTYQLLVEVNLPGIRTLLPLYRQLPVTAVIDFRRPPVTDRSDWGTVTYTLIPTGQQNAAVAYVDSPVDVFRQHGGDTSVLLHDKYISAPGYTMTHLHYVLSPPDSPGFRSKRQGQGAAQYAPIRSFAYHILQGEVKKLGKRELLNAIIRATLPKAN